MLSKVFFEIRNRLSWKGLPHREAPPFLDYRPRSERANHLFQVYELQNWSQNWSKGTLNEVLGILDLLDRLNTSDFRVRKVLDIGSKNWQYAGALAVWLGRLKHSPRIEVFGVELDAYRLYLTLRTRASLGEYFASSVNRRVALGREIKMKYLPMNALQFNDPVDLVTWFFPFVIESVHLAWGLPKETFSPTKLFTHLLTVLNRDGFLVMANQGIWEWEIACESLSNLDAFELVFWEEVRGSLHASSHPIFLSLWRRID